MQAGALDKTVLKALDFHFGTERPEQIEELTAEGYKALQEAERSSCAKKTGAVACVEAVLALAICEVHAYVFNGLDVHGVPRSDCQPHERFGFRHCFLLACPGSCRHCSRLLPRLGGSGRHQCPRNSRLLSRLVEAQPHDPFEAWGYACWRFQAEG